MIYILSFTELIKRWNEQLNDIADELFDNPFSGMAVFIILMVISMIAIKSYSKK